MLFSPYRLVTIKGKDDAFLYGVKGTHGVCYWTMVVTLGARPRPLARAMLWLGLGFFVLSLAVTPLLHHDLQCHLKTPSHCGACVASPPGLSTATGTPLDAPHLHDAGSVKAVHATAPAPTFAVDAPGRSPPA